MEEILKNLIAFPTVSGDREAARGLLDCVDDFVSQRGMTVERYEWGGFESLVAAVVPGNKRPKVMLGAHADVVPGGKELFNLRKSDGKYFGRGVLDMKFAVATPDFLCRMEYHA